MRVVTTCHKAGFEQYGHKCMAGLKLWPKSADVRWYTEGFDLPSQAGITEVKSESLPELAAFKAKYKDYLPIDYRFDVVRFANKSFAVFDALRDYDGLGVWMDADCITTKQPPKGYIESLLPDGCYIALFQRDGMYSETGLWLVDCSHPAHKQFMDTFISWYTTDSFKDCHQWHDCIMLDATIRMFERQGAIKAHNLSGANSAKSHPMAAHDSAKYWDHQKGPKRKEMGRSPERRQ